MISRPAVGTIGADRRPVNRAGWEKTVDPARLVTFVVGKRGDENEPRRRLSGGPYRPGDGLVRGWPAVLDQADPADLHTLVEQ
jgi:hypothetical protein